jgi:hypothetical protein
MRPRSVGYYLVFMIVDLLVALLAFCFEREKLSRLFLADPAAADLAMADLAGAVPRRPAGAERGAATLGRAKAHGECEGDA